MNNYNGKPMEPINVLRRNVNNTPSDVKNTKFDTNQLISDLMFQLNYDKLSKEQQNLYSYILSNYQVGKSNLVKQEFSDVDIENYCNVDINDAKQASNIYNNRRISKALKGMKTVGLITDYKLEQNNIYVVNIVNPNEDAITQEESIAQNDFTDIPVEIIKNKAISYKALGIYAQALSIKETTDNIVNKLSTLKKDGVASVTSGVKELNEAGFSLDDISSISSDNTIAVNNHIFNNSDIKYKTLGTYIQMVALAQTTRERATVDILATYKRDGKRSIETSLKELESAGYMVKNSDDNGYKLLSVPGEE